MGQRHLSKDYLKALPVPTHLATVEENTLEVVLSRVCSTTELGSIARELHHISAGVVEIFPNPISSNPGKNHSPQTHVCVGFVINKTDQKEFACVSKAIVDNKLSVLSHTSQDIYSQIIDGIINVS